MPNWCTNQITINHANKSKMSDVLSELSKGDDCKLFHVLRPMPVSEQDNWYDWSYQNWGVKWDASVYHFEEMQDNKIVIDFDTAWCAPIQLFEYMTRNGWDIEAAYHEPGMGFVGRFISVNGLVIENDAYEWDYEGDAPFDHIPEELVRWANLEESLLEYRESLVEN